MSGKFEHLIPENCAPPNATMIGLYNESGIRRGSIKVPTHMLYPSKTKLYSFCALADVHISYDTANTDFQRALTFVENSDCLFTCIAGDLTYSGNDAQMTQYKTAVDTYATKPVYAIAGNHEGLNTDMTSERMIQYTGHPLYWSFTQGGDVFIMVGCKSNTAGALFTTDELQWLYETLEVNRNKRCFVFTHVFPWGGSGNAKGLYGINIWTSTQGTLFENLMKHYKNVTVFHGHSHFKLYLQEMDKKANYSSADGYRSVHIPSISVPRDIIGTTSELLYADSEGYIVDVFDDCIVLRGRDFIDNETNGNWIPIGTYKIDTKLVDIPAGTFTDSTGTITT